MSMESLRRRVRAILFDWGDTLVRPPGMTTNSEGHFRCVEAFHRERLLPALESAARHHRLEWPRFRDVYEHATMEQIERTLATGREHSFARRIERALELAGLAGALDPADCEALADDLGHRITRGCVPVAGAAETLPRLRTHLRLGLLSNYPHAPAVRLSLQAAGLMEHLDSVTISAETGWSKPWRQAFEAAIADLGHPPGEILFVGDDLDNDMRGARAMGMYTAWLPRADQDAGSDHDCVDVRLTALSDLARLVEGAAR